MPIHYDFKTLFRLIKPYKKELITANIVAFVAAIVNTPVPLLMPMLVDEVLLKKPGFLTRMIDTYCTHLQSPVVYIGIVLLSVIFLRFVFFLLSYWLTKLFTIVSRNVAFPLTGEAM